jgi:hypothetical protein
MALTITSEPIRTIDGVTSNANASRSQIPFILTTTDQAQPNFKINIIIRNADNTANLIATTFKYSPKDDGTLFLDVSQILTEYLEKNGLVSVEFKLRYFQSWTGFTAPSTDSANSYFAIYAQKQIYSSGGANLYNHVLSTTGLNTALTKWIEPRIYSNFKRTIGILYPTSEGAILTIKYLDINKGVISTLSSAAIPTTTGVQNLDLQNYTTAIPLNCHWISAAFTTPSGKSLDTVYYKVTNDCSNPIFVEYLNSLGAYEQYIFDIKQEVQVASSTGIASSRAVNQDYASARVTNIRVANDWVQQLICQTDQLSNTDLLAINEIKRSTSVRVLLTRDGSQFVQVVASNNLSDMYSTDNANNGFTLQLQMPNNFNVFEAIDYTLTPSQAHLNVAFTAAYN